MRKIYLLALVSIISFGAFSQGSIGGTIKDVKTGEAIIGANVVIQGTTIGAATDVEGNFLINNVKEGTYTIVVSYITYKTNTIPDVVVETAKRVTLDIPLAEDVAELSEVVVTAARRTDTDFDLLKSVREAKVVVVGITAEQISKSLDRDAAQVLRRVPGITIRNDQFVQVRGLGERYSAVMLHNAYAPSVETDVRAFSFTTIPSSQLDRMMVYKSPAADLPGDFAGGVVKIFTKSIPDENSVVVDYSTQFRLGTTFNPFSYQIKDNLQFTGYNYGYYDIPDGFPANLSKAGANTLVSAAKQLKNDLWVEQSGTAIPDQRLSLTFNRKFRIRKIEVGNITALTYSNSFTNFNISRSDFNTFNNQLNQSSPIYEFKDSQFSQQVRSGLLFNWAFKFDANNTVEFKNLLNYTSNDQFVLRDATVFENGSLQRNRSFDKVYRGIFSSQLMGTHFLFNKLTAIEWVAGYNNSNRDQPDYKRVRSDIDPASGTATLYIQQGVSPDFFGRFFGKLSEESYTGGLSIKQSLGSSTTAPEIKAGFFYEGKTRSFNARNIGYVRSVGFNNDLIFLSIGQLFQPQNINNTNGIQIAERTNPNDSYRATNNLIAGYLMGSLPVGKLRVDAGVRLESNTQTLKSATFNGVPVDVSYPVSRWLPSANVSYNFSEKSLVRVAYGETLNRPEFRELAPFSFYDFNFNFTNRGNPSLRTARIQNLDLRWEYYPTKAELITFGVFYKLFTDPIETVFDPGAGSLGAKNFSYQNAQSATNYGVELEMKKSLGGLTASPFVNRLGVLFNASLIKSQITLPTAIAAGQSQNRPLQGQAPYVINAGLFYNDDAKGLQINLLYNVVGKNILFVGFEDYPDLYIMPRNVVDLIFTKQLTKRFQLKGGITDILNNPVLILQDGNKDGTFDTEKDQIIQSYKPGQVFSLGVSYTF
jgi:outer membrane receptor protein involved in Fe transport